MLCQKCGLTDATIHREQLVYRRKIEEHLCYLCAGSGNCEEQPETLPPVVAAMRTKTAEEPPLPARVQLPDQIVVRQLAEVLGIKLFRLISALVEEGVFVTLNRSIDYELAARVCARLGVSVSRVGKPT